MRPMAIWTSRVVSNSTIPAPRPSEPLRAPALDVIHSLLPLLFASPAPPVSTPRAPEVEVYSLVRVELDAQGDGMARLAALGLDLSHSHAGAGHDRGAAARTLELVVDVNELALLESGEWDAEVVIEDLATYYARRLSDGSTSFAGSTYGAWLNPPFASGAMSGYYGFTQIESVLDQLQATYPNLVSAKTSLGQSHQGRDLWMVKVSDNPTVDENEPEVRFDSLHHAREPQGMQTSLWFLLWLVEEYGNDPLATYLVNEREIYFVPCVNPDGYVYNQQNSPQGGGMWRKNRRNNGGGSWGVDLNRNYPFQWGYDNQGSSSDPDSDVYRGPSAASEPEVQAIMAFANARDFGTVLSIHTYGDWWLAPLGYIEAAPANGDDYDEVGALATEFNGHPYGPASILLYLANGTTVDYDHGVHQSMTWTPEIGSSSDGFWPSQSRIVPLAEENRVALARTALAAGAYLHVESISEVELVGDGDGNNEGGETIELQVGLRNSGMLASSSVDVQLQNLDPRLEVVVGNAPFGGLASFSSGSAVFSPSLRILPGTPAGKYSYELQVVGGGWQETIQAELTVGTQVTLASFDFEAAGNQGWSVGAPNDASTGNWVRVDPRGTAAQPEDDHTAGGGNTDCWVTGQGSVGGSDGENDVDGGTTTLLSPVFDLSGTEGTTVSYWRWYSNDVGAAPNADVFQVDLSNDGGSNWSSVEVVGPSGPGTSGGWNEVEFDVAAVLSLTDQMRLRFRASDLGDGSIVEAAIDDVTIGYLTDGDCPAPTNYCTTSPNSAGAGATISTGGSTGVADGSFTLHTSGAPPDKFGLFFYGAGQDSTPLGEGTLCISAPLVRLDVLQTDFLGDASQLLTFESPLDPGTSWNFQFWYRDPAGGPVGFNTSDAVNVTFCD